MTVSRRDLKKAPTLIFRLSSLTSAAMPSFLFTTTLAMNSTRPITAHIIRNQKPIVLVATREEAG